MERQAARAFLFHIEALAPDIDPFVEMAGLFILFGEIQFGVEREFSLAVQAVCEMVEEAGGEIVGIAFLIELESLQGRKAITKYPVYSLVKLD